MPHTFVGRTPASAADPLVGRFDFVETSTSRASTPGARQGPAPQILFGSLEKYVALGALAPSPTPWSGLLKFLPNLRFAVRPDEGVRRGPGKL
jgi:hypothetical protein